MTKNNQGFALVIAVIFTAVMLAFSLLIGSLGYKQSILANTAKDSQYAFYAADAGLECLLYADIIERKFAYPAAQPSLAPKLNCAGSIDLVSNPNAADYPSTPLNTGGVVSYSSTAGAENWVVVEMISFTTSPATCAKVTIYKPKATGTTYLFSEGYSADCTTVNSGNASRYAARGIHAFYKTN